MSAKRKNRQSNISSDAAALKRQHEYDRARRAHAKGTMCMEDFIWTAVQCYAADSKNAKSSTRFA